MGCRLCGEPFAEGDKILVVLDKRTRYRVHRPCLGEVVAAHVQGMEAAEAVPPATRRALAESRLLFARKVVERTLAGLAELDKAEGKLPEGQTLHSKYDAMSYAEVDRRIDELKRRVKYAQGKADLEKTFRGMGMECSSSAAALADVTLELAKARAALKRKDEEAKTQDVG
jgi:hypothetical protein